jgi:poly(3-hydroxybutyrate) depolymerase
VSLDDRRSIRRKSAFLINAILLVFPSAYGGSGQITRQAFESGGKSRIFYLFVPDGVTGGPPVPLLVTLHGSGRDGRSLVESWKNIASKEGIILVGPNAENPAGWAAPRTGPTWCATLLNT